MVFLEKHLERFGHQILLCGIVLGCEHSQLLFRSRGRPER